jgi:hypothetical protein
MEVINEQEVPVGFKCQTARHATSLIFLDLGSEVTRRGGEEASIVEGYLAQSAKPDTDVRQLSRRLQTPAGPQD